MLSNLLVETFFYSTNTKFVLVCSPTLFPSYKRSSERILMVGTQAVCHLNSVSSLEEKKISTEILCR